MTTTIEIKVILDAEGVLKIINALRALPIFPKVEKNADSPSLSQ